MTTRRRDSDLNADESRSHKCRRTQPEALEQVDSSKDHMPLSNKGVSSSATPSYTDADWKDNHCVIAEELLVKSSPKAIKHSSPNLDPGLGQLSLLSPELRDLIYELVPVEDNPDIASPCLPIALRWTSKLLSRDLHRSVRPCTHVDFTFTCDVSSKQVIENRYEWLQTRLSRGAHAHNLENIHRVEIVIKNSANSELPTLCYRLVCLPGMREVLHIWFDGPRAGHARLCKFQDQLANSFEAAAICVNAMMEKMRGLPSQIMNSSAQFSHYMKPNDSKLSNLLKYYAAPQAEEHKGPAGKPALCFIACTHPGTGLLEYSFHPTAEHRLRGLIREGFVIRDCPLPRVQSDPEFDLWDWYHEFFDGRAAWQGRAQGEDYYPQM